MTLMGFILSGFLCSFGMRIYNLHYKGAQAGKSLGSGPTHPHNKGPG